MASSEISQPSTTETYAVGQVLSLRVRPEYSCAFPSVIRAQICRLHTRTLSYTMFVKILDDEEFHSPNKVAFLKLFDRRYADQMREDNGIELWRKDLERSYVDSIESGTIYQFLDKLHHIEGFKADTEDSWDDAQNEAFLADEALKLYRNEMAVYRKLQPYQGRIIPQLLAAVDIDIAPAGIVHQSHGREDFEPLKVKGVLLQYLRGYDLQDMIEQFPQTTWQWIVDRAVQLVRFLGDNNILNRDIRPENFLVCRRTDTRDHKQRIGVFMIDFALCRFRKEHESDSEWGKAKYAQDEEGEIGFRMKLFLEEFGFELQYDDSGRYAEWADSEDDFENDTLYDLD